jgi:uncharacterized protein (TIGR02466 family)
MKLLMGTRAEFSVPVYVADVEDDERIAIESEISNLDVEFLSGEDYGLESDALLTNISKNLLSSVSVEKLKSVFLKHLDQYLTDVNSEATDVQVIASWLTKTHKGQSIEPHSHVDKDISGVYYINTNGDDGDLILYSPNPAANTTRFINSGNMLSIKPKAGQIVFFPSWLLHSTTKNRTDNERISLAVDMVVK